MAVEPPPPPPERPPPTAGPPPPPKKRSGVAWPIAAGLLLLVAAAITFAVVRGGGDGTFDDDAYPFTFEYPGDWTESDNVTISQELGASGLDKRAVSLDGSNLIIVERFDLNTEIDEGNLDLAQNELDRLVAQIDPSASGEAGETGGYPSITWDSVSIPQPEGAESKLVALFDGDQEYLLNCQSTEEHRDELAAGCDQALDTLEPK